MCWLLLFIQPAERVEEAVGALFQPLLARLELIVSAQAGGTGAAAAAAAVAVAAATSDTSGGSKESAAILSHMGAALQGLAMVPRGYAVARTMLQQAAEVLRVVAGCWADVEVAEAMSALLCGAVALAGGGGGGGEGGSGAVAMDDAPLFGFISSTTAALATHHPPAAATVASILAQTVGPNAGAAGHEAAAAAITSTGTFLAPCIQTGESDNIVSALRAAAVYLRHCPALLVGSGSLPVVAEALAVCSAQPEPDVCAVVLKCLSAYEQECGGADETAGELASALGPYLPAMATNVTAQLCGRCPEELAEQCADVLYWLHQCLRSQAPNDEHAGVRVVAAAISAAKGGGEVDEALLGLLHGPRGQWVQRAVPGLWSRS